MLSRRVWHVLARRASAAGRAASGAAGYEQVPSPRGLPLVGTTLALLAAGGPGKLHEYVDGRHRRLGPIFRDSIGPVSAVFLSDPEGMRSVFAQEGKYPVHIKPEAWVVYNQKYGCSRGLFFMDGEEWLHYRRILNKLLLKGDLSWIEKSCDVSTELLLKRLHHLSKENQECPNLEKEMYKWTMDVIVSVLLGASSYERSHKELEPLLDKLASHVELVFQTTCKLSLIPAQLAAKYNIPRWKRFERSVATSLTCANEVLDYIFKNIETGDGLLRRMQEETVERPEINRIVSDLILGAGDTTAYTMAWALYLIAKDKKVQESLRKDNDNAMLLRNVVRECLRLYPVAPFLTRVLPEDAVVNGYSIPANTLIIMSIYTSGRDERFFKHPQEFIPDRWLRDSVHGTSSSQQASLPFAIGARSCIGKKIAETQLHMTLSKIVKRFDVQLCNENDVDITLQMIVKPSEPIRLKFNKV